jgi:hypothetical protein
MFACSEPADRADKDDRVLKVVDFLLFSADFLLKMMNLLKKGRLLRKGVAHRRRSLSHLLHVRSLVLVHGSSVPQARGFWNRGVILELGYSPRTS